MIVIFSGLLPFVFGASFALCMLAGSSFQGEPSSFVREVIKVPMLRESSNTHDNMVIPMLLCMEHLWGIKHTMLLCMVTYVW